MIPKSMRRSFLSYLATYRVAGICFTALAAVSLLTDMCYSQDSWGRFRGPNGTGISDTTTIPTNWNDNDYNWRIDLPGVGYSSPVVWNNRIFATTGDPKSARRTIQCLDPSDGSALWRRDFSSTPHGSHASSSYASATPAVDAQGIVATWTTPNEIVVVALNLNGEQMWRRDLGAFVGYNGSGTSPIIAGDLVVITNEQDDGRLLTLISSGKEDPNAKVGKSSVLALDRQSGKTRWELPRGTKLASYATPCVHETEHSEPELILLGTAHGITGVALATGKVNWEISEVFPGRCVGSPVLARDLVIAGDGVGVHGFRCVAARVGMSGPADNTNLAYEVKKSAPLVPTPVVYNDMLFLWADIGVVTCLDADTGDLIWRERVGGDFYGSPVCVNGYLYCIAKNGDVVVVAASHKFQILARVPLGADSFATPAVAGGVMYLRTHSQLFSLGGANTQNQKNDEPGKAD